MRHGQLRRQLAQGSFRQLIEKIFTKIEADSHAIEADQTGHVLDMIDIVIERALLPARANQNGVYADHSSELTNRFDLVITDVALDIEKLARVRVRNDRRLLR